ncbi:MAG: hypothetical protein ABIE22_03835 [archaeon]
MVTREEIEARLKTMSDFLKMEYLEHSLKDSDFGVKRFCHQKLAELYEARKMYAEAAKNMSSVAEVSISFRDKRDAYMKEVELWVKSGNMEMFDSAMTKVLSNAHGPEKDDIRSAVKNLLRRQAQVYEKSMKRAAALKLYEKLYQMAEPYEKDEIKIKLKELYNRLGKIKEYMALR